MASLLFRAGGSRIEHLVVNPDDDFTACGISARGGARYTPADNRLSDRRQRPLCTKCRQAADDGPPAPKVTAWGERVCPTCGGIGYRSCIC